MTANHATVTDRIDALRKAPGALQRRWIGLLLLGILQAIGGIFALAVPVIASLAAAVVFGALLLVLGVFQFVHAWSVRKSKGAVLSMLGGLFYLAGGLLVLIFPVTGAISLTLLVATLLVADGVVRCTLAFRFRPVKGWGWILSAGIASTVVGVMLFIGWPLTGLWALGILFAVNLLFIGVANCALAIAFRTSLARDPERVPPEARGDVLKDKPA